MTTDYQMAIKCLQENLALLDRNLCPEQTPEQMALWNVSNALLVVCDALQDLEQRVSVVQSQTRSKL
jgi:hypothetical protein